MKRLEPTPAGLVAAARERAGRGLRLGEGTGDAGGDSTTG
jgi:hypothetical protein